MFVYLNFETKLGCVLVYRYTKERNINEQRHNSMYGCENNRNSPVYRYTRTAPKIACFLLRFWEVEVDFLSHGSQLSLAFLLSKSVLHVM